MFKDVEQKFIPAHVATTYPSSLASSGLSKSFGKKSMFLVFCSVFFHFPALPSNCPPQISCPNITLLMRSLTSSWVRRLSCPHDYSGASSSLWTFCWSISLCVCVCVCSVTQSCPTRCDSMDCSMPGSSVHAILQARILEWLPCPPPTWTKPITILFPALAGKFFTTSATWETPSISLRHKCF